MMIFWIAVLLLIFHLAYWVYFIGGLITHKDKKQPGAYDTSLVVCFKNEADSVDSFMAAVREQDVEEFIGIDDFSTDGTGVILRNYPELKVFEPEVDVPGKKAAVAKAIAMSSQPYLLFTDADCRPGEHWAATMKQYLHDRDLLLGYAPMQRGKSWVSYFARYETLHTALLYLSFARRGMPYMGVGRNMLVKTEAARRALPALMASKQASGDDDLLVNALATSKNTAITLDPDTFVYSPAKEGLTAFVKQKLRHVSSASSYKFKDQVLLAIYAATFMLFYLLLFPGLMGMFSAPVSWGYLLLAKWVVQGAILYPLTTKFRERDLWFLFPVLDIALFFYLIIISPLMLFHNKEEW